MEMPSCKTGIHEIFHPGSIPVEGNGHSPRYHQAILLLFYVIMAFTVRPLSAQDIPADTMVTIPDTTGTVKDLMQIVERKTGLSFSYNSGIFDEKKIVMINADDEPVTLLIKRLIGDPSLAFRIVGRHLVIYQPIVTRSADPQSRQDSVYFYGIAGRVFDRSSRLPLSYANVYLKGKSIGTISNEDGEFMLKLSSLNLADTLTISYLGYKSHEQEVSTMVNSQTDYYLEMDVVPIQEVIIRLLSPDLLLESAMANIPFNYSVDPVILTSFYRETVKKANRHMIVSEALLENYKPGYDKPDLDDQVRIIRGRSKQNVSREDTVMLKLKAGLNTMMMLDVIKYLPDFMEQDGSYNYSMSDIVMENERENYVLDFAPVSRFSESYYLGRIFIDVKDLSVTRTEFSIDPTRLSDATRLFVVRKPAYLNVKVLEATYEVAYRKIGGKYFLHYVNCETAFRVRYRKQLFGSVYSTTLEMAVTQIDTVNADRFRYREIARTNDVFNEQVTGYNEEFWGEFNFIRPDDPLVRALERLEDASLDLLGE